MPESEPIVESVRVPRPPVEPFESADTDTPRLTPVREGLPPGFRMRADAHYVDQLDSRMSSIPVRLIDASAIESSPSHSDTVSPAFIDSIKRLGVLQPLLVTAHSGRYRVIAGRRRLAAALLAGLREVPCLVQHVDADHAEQMALASNLPAARPRPAPAPLTSVPDKPGVASELTNIVTALVSCAELLASPSALTQSVAADLVRAEAARALDALVAIRVLRDEMPISRAPVAVHTLLERVATAAALERQIRGVFLSIDATPEIRSTTIKADLRLIVTAVSGLTAATAALIESTGNRAHGDARVVTAVRVRVTRDSDRLVLSVLQSVVELPAAWLARPFDIAWPIRDGASALSQLQAARKIAQSHGGDLVLDSADGGTMFSLTLPVTASHS